MRLAKVSTNLLAVLTMSFCLVPGLWGQETAAPATPPQAAPVKGKAGRKSTHKAKSAAPAPKPASAEAATTAGGKVEPVAVKRDPFQPLVSEKSAKSNEHLPPGKAGLVIATVHVTGTVRSPGGMLAVVSNPDQRVYFLREGDRLYDGDVEKIGLDGVTFRENSKDAFGKQVERMVTKRIYPSAGEQQ
jgi:Tfp pilus assembly protein PilP